MMRLSRLYLLPVLLLAASSIAFSQSPASVTRPRITGFSHIAIYVDDLAKAEQFYGQTLGYPQVFPDNFEVNEHQSIELEKAPAGVQDRISHIAFATDSAEGMRLYLKEHGIAVPDSVKDGRNGAKWFALADPAGQPIEFLEEKPHPAPPVKAAPPASRQIIHAGFIVHDRGAEEHFYKDILGFRPYWHGGMTEGKTEWAAFQVPDGTVWIEEMLGASEQPDAHERGVLNHISLGVNKIDTVAPNLKEHGWKPAGNGQEKPQLGKDGKWQLNIYDPDLTRVEYMEFRPAQKPCCSEFTGPHPHE
jgi:catechol 2,3-dioxygenase-like lactoylglutathione lyase family enzyme